LYPHFFIPPFLVDFFMFQLSERYRKHVLGTDVLEQKKYQMTNNNQITISNYQNMFEIWKFGNWYLFVF